MKVYVNGKEYDSGKVPIILAMTNSDKENISRMSPKSMLYMSYPPDTMTVEEARCTLKRVYNINKTPDKE